MFHARWFERYCDGPPGVEYLSAWFQVPSLANAISGMRVDKAVARVWFMVKGRISSDNGTMSYRTGRATRTTAQTYRKCTTKLITAQEVVQRRRLPLLVHVLLYLVCIITPMLFMNYILLMISNYYLLWPQVLVETPHGEMREGILSDVFSVLFFADD